MGQNQSKQNTTAVEESKTALGRYLQQQQLILGGMSTPEAVLLAIHGLFAASAVTEKQQGGSDAVGAARLL